MMALVTSKTCQRIMKSQELQLKTHHLAQEIGRLASPLFSIFMIA
jgi:hypothetical protein